MEPLAGRDTDVDDAREFFVPDLCAPRSVFLLILLAELLVGVHVLARSALPAFDWSLLASGSLFVQWVMLLSAAALCQLRGPLGRLGAPLATLACLLVVAAVTLASSSVTQYLPQPFRAAPATGGQLARNVLVALVVAGVLLRYFFLLQQLRRQEKLELQSRLDSLRDRIRPHFLFNTLNSIASLIATRPEAAEAAVEDLAELFRVSLQEERRSTTVADELRLCELYLGIERLRLGERLQVQWEVAAQAREQPMPSLVLQPLVENAIHHGVATLPEGGTVRIAIALSAGELRASVENPVGQGGESTRGHNLALENVRSRLDALYGAAARLQVEPAEQRFRVSLSYPRDQAT